jgi:maltoporin
MRRAAIAILLIAAPALAQDEPKPKPSPAAEPLPLPSLQIPGDTGKFEFGSYGRVGIASDLRGGVARPANIVTHGTRIDQDPYAELELRREDTFKTGVQSRVVATVAFFPPFFHFNGDFAQAIVLRNLYAQAVIKDQWTLWAGSRMYRGDDIYLLDWWPLDNQNTIGGGAGWSCTCKDKFSITAHVGMQRLDNPYQTQFVPATSPFGVGATQVLSLNRPRIVETLKATKQWRTLNIKSLPGAGFKVSLYGEAHEIGAGVFHDTTTMKDRPLPDDYGFVVGAQAGFWTGQRDTHVNFFVRHARGLAAYDPLAAPQTFANDRTTAGSTETLFALGGNYEHKWFGVLGGAYVRFFRDGDPSPTTTQKYDEGTFVVRPQIFLGELFGIATEGSFQARRYAFLDPATDAPLVGAMWRFGVMPFFSPSGRGSYKRPQFRAVYVASWRNEGARALYPAVDVYAQRDVEHYLGINVEWWFNSSSYP